ncbi:MAG: hypothetical protein AB1498_04090 [bacterium]
MLTLFTVPKPFTGKFNIIQRNSIQSWIRIKSNPEIVLFDKHEGTEKISKELSIRNISDIPHNEFGTPLVNSIFEKAHAAANYDVVCYLNTDIILTDSFIYGIQKAREFSGDNKFLITGRRWSIYLDRPWNFNKGDWQEGLVKYRGYNGFLGGNSHIDYFIFPKDIDWEMPPFLLERGAWEGWFIYNAIKMDIPVIDATDFMTAYHQEHFNFDPEIANKPQIKAEIRKNKKLGGSFPNQYNILDSTHILTSNGLKKSLFTRKFSANILRIKTLFI